MRTHLASVSAAAVAAAAFLPVLGLATGCTDQRPSTQAVLAKQAADEANEKAAAAGSAPATSTAQGGLDWKPLDGGQAQAANPAVPATANAGGIQWTTPDGWAAGKPSPMRAASYLIPPTGGDTEPTECAVFFFGPGEGGSVDSNIARWIGQFEQADGSPSTQHALKAERQTAGLKTTLLKLEGIFQWKAAPMAPGPATPKPGYKLLGAIVEAPQGPVFFKLTGPKATVDASEAAFIAMLDGLKK